MLTLIAFLGGATAGPQTFATVEKQERLIRISLPFDKRPTLVVQKGKTRFSVHFDHRPNIDMSAVQKALPPGVSLDVLARSSGATLQLSVPSTATLRVASYFQKSTFVIDVFRSSFASPKPIALKKTIKAASSSGNPSPKKAVPVHQTPQKIQVRIDQLEKKWVLTLVQDKPVPLAIFRRGANTWIVFRKQDAQVSLAVSSAWRSIIHQDTQDQRLTVLKIQAPHFPIVFASPCRDGVSVELSSVARPPFRPLVVEKKHCGEATCAVLGWRGDVLESWRDPDLGDELSLGLTAIIGQGLAEGLRTADLRILPSAQGVVMKTIAHDLTLRPSVDHDLEISRPGGLLLSEKMDPDHALVWDGSQDQTFFDWKQWAAQTTWDPQKTPLVVRGKPGSSDVMKQTRALKYRLAHQAYADVCRAIDQGERDDPWVKHNAELQALKGAACALDQRFDLAEQALATPEIRESPEIKMWLAYLAARTGAWQRSMRLYSSVGLQTLAEYPDTIFTTLVFPLVEAALVRQDPERAVSLLTQYREHPLSDPAYKERWTLADAWLSLQQKKSMDVTTVLKPLMHSAARDVQQVSEVLSLQNEYQKQDLSVDEYVQKMMALRTHWLNSRFEGVFYTMMAQILETQKRWIEALRRYDDAFKRVRDIEEKNALQTRAAVIMKDQLTSPLKAETSVLRDLALFTEFKHFVPRNEEGNAVILALVDRLQRVDLLEDAIRLLNHLVQRRVSEGGQDKLIMRIAWLQLLNQQPEETLKTLGRLRDAATAPAVAESDSRTAVAILQDRRYLKAQALVALGRCSLVLELLANDASLTADHLRTDCAWQNHEWSKAADLLLREVALFALPGSEKSESAQRDQAQGGDPSKTLPSADLLVRTAVALSLSHRKDDLKRLAEIYGPMMATTSLRETFALLTEWDDEQRLDRMSDIPDFLKETRNVSLFMDEYRRRIDLRESSESVPMDAPSVAKATEPSRVQPSRRP